MTKAFRKARKAVAMIVSLALATAPLSLMPVTVSAQAENTNEENNLDRIFKLDAQLVYLLDRATYPNVPRRGLRGLPSPDEVKQAEQKLLELSRSMQAIPASVFQITDEREEVSPFIELQAYFECASKFEGLKVLLGQPVNPQIFESRYHLEFSLNDLSQLRFMQVASLLSDTFVRLPGHNDELTAIRASTNLTMRSNLDLRRRMLTLHLSPLFLENYERMVFMNQMNTKASLLFAGHFAAHRLEDSLAATRFLLRQSAENTPEVPAFWMNHFPSMRVKRAENIRTQKINALKTLKPQVLNAFAKAYVNLENQGRALVYDDQFFRQVRAAAGIQNGGMIDLLKVNADETSSWLEALRTAVSLWNLENIRNDAQVIAYEAKRISLRWMILAEDSWAQRLSPEARITVEKLIDERARAFTKDFMADIELQKNLSELAMSGTAQARQNARAEFQKKLKEASEKLRDFATQDVNVSALIRANKGAIKDLLDRNSSAFLSAAMEAMGKATGYAEAYNNFNMILYSMLLAYKLPEVKAPLTIKQLDGIKRKIEFNPSALTDSVPQKYIDVLKAEASKRKEDVSGMIELAQIMKFDRFEQLSPGQKATPETLKLSNGLFGLGSEKETYFAEFKKDIVNNAPVLGAVVNGTAVWESLSAGRMTEQQAADLVDNEMKEIPSRIDANLKSLQEAFEKIETGDDHSLANANVEMRTLVTRATQLNFVLSSFSGFSQLNDEIRAELLAPGFWEREWRSFNDWSNNVLLYMIGFMALQMIGSKSMAAGRMADSIGKLLTPIFGPNFSRLNKIIWGIFGISIADSAVRGFAIEPYRASILQKYSECNAGGPCVALYADVENQSEIARSSRNEVLAQAGMIGALMLGFWGARKIMTRFSRSMPQNTLIQFKADLKTLGLNENSTISRAALEAGETEAIRRARLLPDPVAAELAVAYARQAAFRLDQMVWKEAARWMEVETRFAPEFKKMGIGRREAKTQSLVNALYDDLGARFASGKITASELQEMRSTLLSYYQVMSSTWLKMDKNPVVKSFYERVFDAAGMSVKGEVAGQMNFLNKQVHEKFMAEIEKQFITTHTSRRFDNMLENMIKQIQERPEQAREQMQDLLKLLARGGKK